VRAYKDLAHVEQAFRSYKTVDLKVRLIYHYLADRVRAHVFLCMLAYYVEWHMRQALAPLLFDAAGIRAAPAHGPQPPRPPRWRSRRRVWIRRPCSPSLIKLRTFVLGLDG
jgi:hypothetical protein